MFSLPRRSQPDIPQLQNDPSRIPWKDPAHFRAHQCVVMEAATRVHQVSTAALSVGAQDHLPELQSKNLCQLPTKSWWHPAKCRVRGHAYEQLGWGVASPARTFLMDPIIAARVAATRGLRRTLHSDAAGFLDHPR
jgi:hypothetical protein